MINAGLLSSQLSAGKMIQLSLDADSVSRSSQATPFEDITAGLAGESSVAIQKPAAPAKLA